MAIAAPPPIQIQKMTSDYLDIRDGSLPNRSFSSPGGTRRTVPAGQQFGRYQDNSPEESLNNTTPPKNSSSLSLEAIAALLSSSTPDEYSLMSSSPPTSTSRYSRSVKPDRFRKSHSLPIIKPVSLTHSQHKPRPPIRKARSVKFADSKGLPLASIRKLTSADPFQTEGTIVPKILTDLGALSFKGAYTTPTTTGADGKGGSPKSPTRKLHFNQPGSQPDFFNKLKSQNVSLESISTSQPKAIHGIVRVMNISYDKNVSVRWTQDDWATQHDSECSYCQGSSDGMTDRFSFTIPVGEQKVQFAVCYRVHDREYWDSFNGQNYLISVED